MTASPTVPISALMQLKADAVSHRERLGALDTIPFTADLRELVAAGNFGDNTTNDARRLATATAEAVGQVVQWIATELGLNLAPMFEATVDAIHADVYPELQDLQDTVEELVEETGDQLTEDTSSQILAVFQQGRAICNMLEGLAKHVDAVTKKRVAQAIKLFRTSETAVREVVLAVTLAPEDVDVEEPTSPGEEPEEAPEDGEPAVGDPGEGEVEDEAPGQAEG